MPLIGAFPRTTGACRSLTSEVDTEPASSRTWRRRSPRTPRWPTTLTAGGRDLAAAVSLRDLAERTGRCVCVVTLRLPHGGRERRTVAAAGITGP
jgi:hypothetical protein